jgi:hypothetical protein
VRFCVESVSATTTWATSSSLDVLKWRSIPRNDARNYATAFVAGLAMTARAAA